MRGLDAINFNRLVQSLSELVKESCQEFIGVDRERQLEAYKEVLNLGFSRRPLPVREVTDGVVGRKGVVIGAKSVTEDEVVLNVFWGSDDKEKEEEPC